MPTQRTSPAKRFFLARIFPWIVVFVGAFAMFVGIENGVKARDSLQWPTVEGKVVSSSIQSERTSRGAGGGSSTTYRARVVYEYAVDRTTYNGERIAYGEYATGNPADAERIIEKYPKDKKILVYYMPDNHGESVLEPGQAGLPWFFLGLGVVFLFIGIVLVVFLPKLAAREIRLQSARVVMALTFLCRSV
jgi:hypothetical protein